MAIRDNNAVLGSFQKSREVPLHFGFVNRNRDEPCKYLIALETLKDVIEAGENRLVESAIRQVIRKAVKPSEEFTQDLRTISSKTEACKIQFGHKVDSLDAAALSMRDELKPRSYLDVTYESGIVEREGYSNQADLNGSKEGRTLFEIALKAVGNPTKRDEMIAMVYQGKERTNSAIIGVRSTLNAKLEKLNLEVDKEFCLRNFRSEK